MDANPSICKLHTFSLPWHKNRVTFFIEPDRRHERDSAERFVRIFLGSWHILFSVVDKRTMDTRNTRIPNVALAHQASLIN